MAVTGAIIAISTAVIGGATSAYQSHEAGVKADKAAKQQEGQQLAMQKEMQQKQAQDDAQAAQESQQAALRQRALASGYRAGSGGFNTSPLGLPGDGNTAKGSLLGL